MLGIRIRHSTQFESRAIPHWACTAAMGSYFHPNIPTERYQREDKDAALQGFRASERPGLLPSSHYQPQLPCIALKSGHPTV
jgi:hypothetical protein